MAERVGGDDALVLAAVLAVARARHDRDFAELEAAQQDAILADLETGSADDWPTATTSLYQNGKGLTRERKPLFFTGAR